MAVLARGGMPCNSTPSGMSQQTGPRAHSRFLGCRGGKCRRVVLVKATQSTQQAALKVCLQQLQKIAVSAQLIVSSSFHTSSIKVQTRRGHLRDPYYVIPIIRFQLVTCRVSPHLTPQPSVKHRKLAKQPLQTGTNSSRWRSPPPA